MRASFQFTGDPPVVLLSIAGELDLASSERLRAVLTGLKASGCTRMALDLDEVTFVDAYSLRMLDQHRQQLARERGALLVVAASDCVLRVAELAGYDELRPVVRDLLEAYRPEGGRPAPDARSTHGRRGA